MCYQRTKFAEHNPEPLGLVDSESEFDQKKRRITNVATEELPSMILGGTAWLDTRSKFKVRKVWPQEARGMKELDF